MSDFKKRLITGIVMFVVLVPPLFLGGYCVYILAGILAAIGTFEVTRMYVQNKDCKYYQVLIPIYSLLIVLMVMYCDLKLNGHFEYVIGLVLLIFMLLIVNGLISSKTNITDSFFFIGTIIYICLSFSMMCLIRCNSVSVEKEFLLGSYNVNISGLAMFCFILLSTFGTDIGAYTFGNLFGKHKLCPTVSPHKSVEGAIGGCILGTILGSACLLVLEKINGFNFGVETSSFINIFLTIIISLVLTVVSQMGDLIASKLKREYGIKDYGKIFPGHGGVMDRFDSLSLTSLVMGIILIFIGLI